jgi:hypothetical protein
LYAAAPSLGNRKYRNLQEGRAVHWNKSALSSIIQSLRRNIKFFRRPQHLTRLGIIAQVVMPETVQPFLVGKRIEFRKGQVAQVQARWAYKRTMDP